MGRNIDTIYLTNQFKKYNTLYFNGILPLPKFIVTNTKRTLGQYRYRKYEVFNKHTICVTNYYDIDDKKIDNILIHEMIHYYLKFTNNRDTTAHGTQFKMQCARINQYGWNLSRCTSITDWKPKVEPKKVNKTYHICIYQYNNGKSFIFRYSETKRNMYEDWMKKRNVKYRFFTSNNPFFEKFTSCRSRVIGFYTYQYEELKQYEKLLE